MNKEEFYLSIINQIQEGIYYVDKDRRILFWNRAAETITGYEAREIQGRRCENSGLTHIDLEGNPLCTLGCPLFAALSDGVQRRDQVFLRHKNGHRIPVEISIFPVKGPEGIAGAVEMFSPISSRCYDDELIDHLTQAAMQDALTGLPNRRHTETFLEYKLQQYRRFGRKFVVLYGDIDDFSQVNNRYGHDAGDAVLRNVAKSLQSSIRREDLVGRWGGEELLAIYTVHRAEQAAAIGERFRSLVEGTLTFCEGRMLRVTISVGAAVVGPEDTPESLTKRADQLLYESKRRGKNRVTTEKVRGNSHVSE